MRSESGRESPEVRHDARRDENVSGQIGVANAELCRRLTPTILLTTEFADQFLRADQLFRDVDDFLLQTGLLASICVEFALQLH